MRTIISPARPPARRFTFPAVLSSLLVFAAAAPLAAQVSAGKSGTPPADPADVESIDAIMAAVYDVISGPAGEARDWDRMRSLFVEDARLIPTGRDQAGTGRMQVWSVEEYISQAGPFLEERGFFEVEVGRVTEQFGSIAHLMSAYESRWKEDDPDPFVRGVNSFQLWNDGERWWVVSIMWQDERSGGEIPERYLGTHDHSTGADHSMHDMDHGTHESDSDAGSAAAGSGEETGQD